MQHQLRQNWAGSPEQKRLKCFFGFVTQNCCFRWSFLGEIWLTKAIEQAICFYCTLDFYCTFPVSANRFRVCLLSTDQCCVGDLSGNKGEQCCWWIFFVSEDCPTGKWSNCQISWCGWTHTLFLAFQLFVSVFWFKSADGDSLKGFRFRESSQWAAEAWCSVLFHVQKGIPQDKRLCVYLSEDKLLIVLEKWMLFSTWNMVTHCDWDWLAWDLLCPYKETEATHFVVVCLIPLVHKTHLRKIDPITNDAFQWNTLVCWWGLFFDDWRVGGCGQGLELMSGPKDRVGEEGEFGTTLEPTTAKFPWIQTLQVPFLTGERGLSLLPKNSKKFVFASMLIFVYKNRKNFIWNLAKYFGAAVQCGVVGGGWHINGGRGLVQPEPRSAPKLLGAFFKGSKAKKFIFASMLVCLDNTVQTETCKLPRGRD